MQACWFLFLLLHYFIHTVCSDHLGVVILEHDAHPALALSRCPPSILHNLTTTLHLCFYLIVVKVIPLQYSIADLSRSYYEMTLYLALIRWPPCILHNQSPISQPSTCICICNHMR